MPIQINRSAGFRDTYDLWWYYPAAGRGGTHVARFVPFEDGARVEFVEVKEGDESKPTLVLTGRDIRDLKEALDREGPTTNDSVTHLRDAVQVRDRLLTLVEGAMNARNS